MAKGEDIDTTTIGKRLRTLRQAMGWTLEKLSLSSGVSPSNISKIEKGTVTPAFDTLLRLARSLGASFEDLVGFEEAGEGSAKRTITKRGQTIHFSTNGYEYDVHASELRTKRMIPLDMTIKNREPPPASEWSSHVGEEFIYVVAGAIELYTRHYTPQHLEAGESAYIDSSMPHAFVSVGPGDAHVLSICFAKAIPLEIEIAKEMRARHVPTNDELV